MRRKDGIELPKVSGLKKAFTGAIFLQGRDVGLNRYLCRARKGKDAVEGR